MKGMFGRDRNDERGDESPKLPGREAAVDSITRNGASPQDTEPNGLGGLALAVTDKGGKETQQDAARCLELPECKIVAVADGVSSSANSKIAARQAASMAVSVLGSYASSGINGDVLREAFDRANTAIRQEVGWRRNAGAPHTTLLLGVELEDRLLLAYAGDGAIVLCNGDLHWMTNVLHPYVGEAEMLTGYLGRADGGLEPAVLELPKHWPTGIVVLLGTDGALELGKVMTTSGEILFEIAKGAQDWTEDQLTEQVRSLLQSWVSDRLDSDDNRSLGLIISREALRRWQEM